ncbi:hypothetical protein F441_02140 [Phytophthora nicotianae CJ01A1]|uniref:Uncharacterized protein n=1 Tax=Phytophthora nicotianae CJ01A1 TaxID=1317063 RepID=W2XPZ3_PHYNI|nr:hypothetical protein F441_02140 [Phytophthora nicotianae CJ01A1]
MKVAVVLFLVDLAAHGTQVVDVVQSATVAFKLDKTVVWEVRCSRRMHPRKPKETKRTKAEIAQLVAGVPMVDRQILESLSKATAIPKM